MGPVLTIVASAVAAWWASRRERASAEHALAIKEIEAGVRGGDPFLRRFLGVLVFGPVVIAVYDPEWGAAIFDRLEVLPAWYVETLMLVLVSVFGLSVAKEVLPSLLERVLKAWRNGKGA